jgi:1,4-alpha-glucan branching enzyme
LISLEILPQRSDEFRYNAPNAQPVELRCEFNGWKGVPMAKGNDVWTVKIDLPAGTHAHKFLVDGEEWVFDPKNSARRTVDATENSAVEIK